MKRAHDRFKYVGHVPGGVLIPHRDETSPFFPGMMLARAQVLALRQFYKESNPKLRSGDPVTDDATHFAWAALGLVLFGFVEEEKEVLGLLRARGSAKRSVSIPDLVLVEWSSDPRRVSGLRGLAAIAITTLAKRRHGRPMPPFQDIDEALAKILPTGLGAGQTGVLKKLCETVHVCNRIELSGMARLGLDPENGSVSAAISQQVAWLDRDPVSPAAAPASPPRPAPVAPLPSHRRGEARIQYRDMLTVFPSGSTTTELPRTGKTITAADMVRGRTKIGEELAAWESDPETNEVVAMLAHWSLKMLRDGTVNTRNPALSTVHGYLTSVGSQLVTLSEGCRLSDLDEADLAQLYLDCVEIKPSFARARTAREILNFHAAVADAYQLAPIDESELAAYAPEARRSVDAELITPAQRDWALQTAAAIADPKFPRGGHSLNETRLYRQMEVLLDLQGSAGTRFGEGAGMHLRDMATHGDGLVLRVAANRNRPLKTAQSSRTIDLSFRNMGGARAATLDWIEAERGRLGPKGARHAYLSCTPGSTKDLSAKPYLRTLVCQTLARATGRPSERDHRLRHCCGTEGVLDVCLSSSDKQSLAWLVPLAQRHSPLSIPFPRDLHQQSRVLGQSTPITTIRSYFHMPWALRSRSDEWIATRWLDRHTAATALGVTPFAADRIVQRNKAKEPVVAWLDSMSAPRVIETPQALVRPNGANSVELTSNEIGQILGWTSRLRGLEAVGASLGASQSDIAAIRAAAMEYVAKMGRGFLSTEDIATSKASAKRVRALKGGGYLLKLLAIADGGSGDALRGDFLQVAAAHFAWAKAVNSADVVLPSHEAKLLVKLLGVIGHAERYVQVKPRERANLFEVQVLDPSGGKYTLGRQLKRLLGVVWVANRVKNTNRT